MNGAVRRGWLVFDVDDTLVATYRVGLRKCEAVARRLALVPPTEREFGRLYGRLSFRECVAWLHPGVDVDRYQTEYDSLAADFPVQPLCLLGPVVAGARMHGFGVGVLTNGPQRKTARKLQAAGVTAADFDFVCHADNSAVAKPDPAAFTRLAVEFGVDPARAWYVSDEPADWHNSRRAGFGSIAVIAGSRGRSPGDLDRVPPDLVVVDPGALADLIRELAALAEDPPARRPVPIAALSFDAGFTLIEHITPAEEIVAASLRRRGVEVAPLRLSEAFAAAAPILSVTRLCWSSDAEIARSLTLFYRTVTAVLAGRLINDTAAEEVISAYTSASNWRARPGARAALTAARDAGLRIGVLANWQSNLPDALAAAGLADLLDASVPTAEAGAGKPASAAFATVAERLDVDLYSLAHLGDDPIADAGGALRAGARAAYLPRTAAPGALRKAVEVLRP